MEPIKWGNFTLTEWFIVVNFLICILFDFYVKIFYGDSQTLTFTLQRWAAIDFKVAVLAALIFGHVFLSSLYPK